MKMCEGVNINLSPKLDSADIFPQMSIELRPIFFNFYVLVSHQMEGLPRSVSNMIFVVGVN